MKRRSSIYTRTRAAIWNQEPSTQKHLKLSMAANLAPSQKHQSIHLVRRQSRSSLILPTISMTASTSSSRRVSADRNRFTRSPSPSAQEKIAIIRLSYSSSPVAYSITSSRTTSENILLSRDSFRQEDCAQLSSDVNWISEGFRRSTSRRSKMILNRHVTSSSMPKQSPNMMAEDEVEDR